MKQWVTLAVMGWVLVGLAACAQEPAPEPQGAPQLAAPPQAAPAPTVVPAVQEVLIRATEWKFEPAIVRVKLGQTVKLRFQNQGEEDHDIVLKGVKGVLVEKHEEKPHGHEEAEEPEGEIHAEAEKHEEEMHVGAEHGHSSTLVFIPTEPGTYPLVCSYEGHTEQGQRATLIVER